MLDPLRVGVAQALDHIAIELTESCVEKKTVAGRLVSTLWQSGLQRLAATDTGPLSSAASEDRPSHDHITIVRFR